MIEIISQSITIHYHPEEIFNELIMWGEGLWWPKRSLMRYRNLTWGIEKNTVYVQKVRLPFGPSWHTRIDEIDKKNFLIRRIFLDGMFKGFEEIKLSPLSNNTACVEYHFNCSVKGYLNYILWKLVFRRLHIYNINLILNSLKQYLERQ